MSLPKRDPQGNDFTEGQVISQTKTGKRLLSHESLTQTPAFKRTPSPCCTLSSGSMSPSYNDLSAVKLPQLVSQSDTELAVREIVRNEGPSFVTPLKTTRHSSVRQFHVENEKHAEIQEKVKPGKECKLCRPRNKQLTGTEVVEILAKKKQLGELDFYYLKASEDSPYGPYNLQVISRNEAATDHYIFSPTTVIHMQDGRGIELWSLAEWYREAVLCEAVRDIQFFRNGLLRKTFKRWHSNVHKVTVKRRIEFLPSQLLIAVPHFRNALLHLARLTEELKQVSWLPQDDLRTYTLSDFQTVLLEKNQTAQESLDRFLHCRAAILNMVKDKSYQASQELQMEMKNVKLYQSSQSFHLQVSNLRNLQKELSQAEQAIHQLGNLASLADRMTIQTLVTISKGEITAFLNKVVKREREEQSGLFQVEFIFGADCELTVFPPLHLFQEVLHNAALSVEDSILQVFDSCSLSFESKGCLATSSIEDLFAEFKDKIWNGTGPNSERISCKKDRSPQTIGPVKINSLRVQAQRVQGHFQPLPWRLLEWNLKVHVETQEIQNEQHKITQDAITEVLQLCESHLWLTDIHLFISQWGSDSLETLCGCSPLKYKELLKKLHFWLNRVNNMPQSFTTSNKLFTVYISNIQKHIGSMLSAIDKDVLKLLCKDLQMRSENLTSQLKRAMETMQSEPNSFHKFTAFAIMVKQSGEMSENMQQQLEDLHSLQKSLRRNYAHVPLNEIISVKQVANLWDCFVPLLKQAADKVSQMLPSMMNTLDHEASSLMSKLDKVVSMATSGPYLDPDQMAKQMLPKLKILCIQFDVIADQLHDQSRASEILRGHQLDLTCVTVAQQKIEARKRLWEVVSMSSMQIQEWKLLNFRKFVVADAENKVNAWIQQVEQFAKVIPSNDMLLQTTQQFLQEFNQRLPVLSKLSSPTLKHKHWRKIAKGTGLLYNPERKLTVADLMSEELQGHQYKINKIYLDSKAEADMEQKFRTLQRQWEEMEFLYRRFIIAVQQQQSPQLGGASPQNAPTHISDGGTFTIIGLENLLTLTEQSILILSDILHSPHADEFQRDVEHWLLVLQELDELLNIFEKYQQKWVFLSRIFSETVHQNLELQERFLPVDKIFREFIEITVKDPRVCSFVQLTATTEFSGSLQGQSLRDAFVKGITTMEEISIHFLSVLESAQS